MQFVNAASNGSYVPDGLELVQAHWFVRHGERTPVRSRMTGLAGIPATFRLCSVGREFKTTVAAFNSPNATPIAGESHSYEGGDAIETTGHATQQPSPADSFAAETTELAKSPMLVRRLTEVPSAGNDKALGTMSDCYWGELTDLGRASTLGVGAALRKIYVDDLKFLPSLLPDERRPDSIVEFRSTGMNRTIETLHQVVQGLFPIRQGAVEYVVRAPEQESLYPNSLCTRMRTLDKASADRAAQLYNPSLVPLDALIGKYIDAPVRIDGVPRANGILDTIASAKAHGIKVPKEFDDVQTMRTLEDAVVHEWFDSYQSQEFKRLAMGRLLGDLRTTMEKKTLGNEKLKLAVYACHDTSLAGILNALDVFDSRWPPFTSNVSVELFKPKDSPAPSFLSSFTRTTPPHYVRMRYNGKPVFLPACKTACFEGSKGEICTFEGFKNALKDVEMTNKEWEGVCAQR